MSGTSKLPLLTAAQSVAEQRQGAVILDTRPAERNSDHSGAASSPTDSRDITWTHYYAKEDAYNRIDYILLSPSMAREWVQSETYVLTLPGWGIASDHRPIVAAFETDDK